MNSETKVHLAGMFSCFPQSPDIEPRAYLQGLVIACDGLDDAAICEAVDHVVAGKAEGINQSFCPSTAAFGAYARKLDERNRLVRDRLSRPALPAPAVVETHNWVDDLPAERRAEIKAASAAILKKFARA